MPWSDFLNDISLYRTYSSRFSSLIYRYVVGPRKISQQHVIEACFWDEFVTLLHPALSQTPVIIPILTPAASPRACQRQDSAWLVNFVLYGLPNSNTFLAGEKEVVRGWLKYIDLKMLSLFCHEFCGVWILVWRFNQYLCIYKYYFGDFAYRKVPSMTIQSQLST